MSDLLQSNILLVVLALLIGLAVAWLIWRGTRRTRVETTRTDVLDEGAARAHRNQALIDSAPAATTDAVAPPAAPAGLAGAGTAVTAAAEAQEHAVEDAQAEIETEDPSLSDDLTRIKGLGPKLKAVLADMGVTRFEHIAAWDDPAIDRVDAQLGRFQGRIRRDDWVGQARLLAAGDEAAYKETYGQL